MTNDIRDEQARYLFIRGMNATEKNPKMRAAFINIMRAQLPEEQRESLEGVQFFAALGDKDAQARLKTLEADFAEYYVMAPDPTKSDIDAVMPVFLSQIQPLKEFINANPFAPASERERKQQYADRAEEEGRLAKQKEFVIEIDIRNAKTRLFKYGIDSQELAEYLDREHGKVNRDIWRGVMFELGITTDDAGKLVFIQPPPLAQKEVEEQDIAELPISLPNNLDLRLKTSIQYQMLDRTLDHPKRLSRNTGRALLE